MSKLGYFGSFVMGGAIGVFVTWIFVKKKYEKIAEEEIQSVKEAFSKESHIVIVKSEQEAREMSEKAMNKPDIDKYSNILSENNYTRYKNALNEVKKTAQESEIIFPYPIEPDEFGENGYDRETLIYYEGDNVVADERGKIVDNPDEVVGVNNLDDFVDRDVMYIRNENTEVDYEIIKDTSTFEEAYGNHPYQETDE